MGATLPRSEGLGLNQSEIDEVRAKVIPIGSVIISCVGDLGIVSIAGVPMVINQQLHSFQCGDELNNLFLMYSLSFQKAFMLAKASSTTLPYMNKSVCNSIPVLVPPLVLQQTFATRIQAIESLKTTHRTALTELDALFASLQQRAFAGEL
jgi:type I restriction enzyme S subunit